MNTLDIIICIISIIALIHGYRKGLISQLTNLVAIFFAIVIANTYYSEIGKLICNSFHLSPGNLIYILAYILILIVIFFLIYLIGKIIEKIISTILLGWLNRLLGAILSYIFFCVMLTLIISMINIFANNFDISMPNWYNKSYTVKMMTSSSKQIMPTLYQIFNK